MSMDENIKSGKYENKMEYPKKPSENDFRSNEDGVEKFHRIDYEVALSNFREAIRAYRQENVRLDNLFKADALEELGLTDHPKANRFFELCWNEGHGSGFYEVWNEMDKWSDLLIS